jgi:outer membrane protein OmpA-like peptidoglycan-associated protein
MAVGVFAQHNYTIKLLPGVNTAEDDIACSISGQEMIYMTVEPKDLVNDYAWNYKPMFHLLKASRGETFSQWNTGEEVFQRKRRGDEGPGSYNSRDSVIYFSSPENFGATKGSNLKIYWSKLTETGWTDPVIHPLCIGTFDYTHPHYDASQNLLVFSSNKPGGFGQMDIWFSYYHQNNWTEPVNLGMMVNSAENDIFPTVYRGDIYYSTNAAGGVGGYDLRKAIQTQQWQASVSLGAPFNSEGDDLSLLFLNDDKAFLTSNRIGGMGGDDIYVLDREVAPEELVDFKAVLEFEGSPYKGATVVATNEIGELVLREKSDSLGEVNIDMMQFQKKYKLQLSGVDVNTYESFVLVLYDTRGNRVREIAFNKNGFANLELLPLSFSELNLLPLEDESVLTLHFQGQLYSDKPGDIGRNEPVTILGEDGNPIAIAYTNEVGKFQFTKVEPRSGYVFQLSKETSAKNVLIMDKGERITLPVLNAEIHYTRLKPEESIELINEYNERIVVSLKDIFVINRIYYEYNSSSLTAESRGQLEQILMIMQRNPNVGLEMRSHTDSRGKDEYNMELSEKRAKSAVNYLVNKGISQKRFKAEGFGETLLLNECDDGVNCSDPEHAINRRTEIRILKM